MPQNWRFDKNYHSQTPYIQENFKLNNISKLLGTKIAHIQVMNVNEIDNFDIKWDDKINIENVNDGHGSALIELVKEIRENGVNFMELIEVVK